MTLKNTPQDLDIDDVLSQLETLEVHSLESVTSALVNIRLILESTLQGDSEELKSKLDQLKNHRNKLSLILEVNFPEIYIKNLLEGYGINLNISDKIGIYTVYQVAKKIREREKRGRSSDVEFLLYCLERRANGRNPINSAFNAIMSGQKIESLIDLNPTSLTPTSSSSLESSKEIKVGNNTATPTPYTQKGFCGFSRQELEILAIELSEKGNVHSIGFKRFLSTNNEPGIVSILERMGLIDEQGNRIDQSQKNSNEDSTEDSTKSTLLKRVVKFFKK